MTAAVYFHPGKNVTLHIRQNGQILFLESEFYRKYSMISKQFLSVSISVWYKYITQKNQTRCVGRTYRKIIRDLVLEIDMIEEKVLKS